MVMLKGRALSQLFIFLCSEGAQSCFVGVHTMPNFLPFIPSFSMHMHTVVLKAVISFMVLEILPFLHYLS